MIPENQVPKNVSSLAIVIFGVTGDLTRRKLIPAIYALTASGALPQDTYLIGFARRDWTDQTMRDVFVAGIEESVKPSNPEPDVVNHILEKSTYVQSTFEDPDGYQRLCERLQALNVESILFYLATPPEEYPNIVRQIGAAGISRPRNGWTRIIIEKPYGQDLESAIELDATVHQVFDENQIYRIDHYLGKETVQNIIVFRFANAIFEPLWNRRYVDHIQISVSETVGVSCRVL